MERIDSRSILEGLLFDKPAVDDVSNTRYSHGSLSDVRAHYDLPDSVCRGLLEHFILVMLRQVGVQGKDDRF